MSKYQRNIIYGYIIALILIILFAMPFEYVGICGLDGDERRLIYGAVRAILDSPKYQESMFLNVSYSLVSVVFIWEILGTTLLAAFLYIKSLSRFLLGFLTGIVIIFTSPGTRIYYYGINLVFAISIAIIDLLIYKSEYIKNKKYIKTLIVLFGQLCAIAEMFTMAYLIMAWR